MKVGIELGIGLVCKLAAEKEKRRSAFKREIDFVFANVIMVRTRLMSTTCAVVLSNTSICWHIARLIKRHMHLAFDRRSSPTSCWCGCRRRRSTSAALAAGH